MAEHDGNRLYSLGDDKKRRNCSGYGDRRIHQRGKRNHFTAVPVHMGKLQRDHHHGVGIHKGDRYSGAAGGHVRNYRRLGINLFGDNDGLGSRKNGCDDSLDVNSGNREHNPFGDRLGGELRVVVNPVRNRSGLADREHSYVRRLGGREVGG